MLELVELRLWLVLRWWLWCQQLARQMTSGLMALWQRYEW